MPNARAARLASRSAGRRGALDKRSATEPTGPPVRGRHRRTLLAAAMIVLVDNGYEPRTDGTALVLANCPFHALAEEYTDLVCGMNLDLLSGLVDGLHHPDVEARLEPTPGLCCVRLRTTNDRPPEPEVPSQS